MNMLAPEEQIVDALEEAACGYANAIDRALFFCGWFQVPQKLREEIVRIARVADELGIRDRFDPPEVKLQGTKDTKP